LTTDQKFFAHHRFVTDLLGSNIEVPRADRITTRDLIEEFEQEAATPRAWDHLSDAFEPVRALVVGEDLLVPKQVYAQIRSSTARVITQVSVVHATQPWAFFAVKGTQWGAPRWVYFDSPAERPIVDLEAIAERLRRQLTGRETRPRDRRALETLETFVDALARTERQLLPRKKQVALAEMRETLRGYERQAVAEHDEPRPAFGGGSRRATVARWPTRNLIEIST
jgi:hypothetical protein